VTQRHQKKACRGFASIHELSRFVYRPNNFIAFSSRAGARRQEQQ
jgi:hypothetical protein